MTGAVGVFVGQRGDRRQAARCRVGFVPGRRRETVDDRGELGRVGRWEISPHSEHEVRSRRRVVVPLVAGLLDDEGADPHALAAGRAAHPSSPGVDVDVEFVDASEHLAALTQFGDVADHRVTVGRPASTRSAC
jgi:hypothetical protein